MPEVEITPDQKEYEISFLVRNEEGISVVLNLIKQHGFEVTSEGPIKRINLAYKIQKESEGYFSFFHILGNPESIQVLDHDLKTNSGVIRSLIITPPFTKTKTTVLPRSRIRPSAAPKAEPEPKILPLSNEALEKKIEEILQ